MFSGEASVIVVVVVGFQIQGGFGAIGEVAIEAEKVTVAIVVVALGGGGATVVTFEHCAYEGGFHGVEEVHVFLVRPKRCRFT